MLQIIQSGSNINSVYSLLEKFIIKKYLNREKTIREHDGMQTWVKHLDYKVTPKQYLKIGPIAVFGKVKQDAIKVEREILFSNLAELYTQLIQHYSYHKEDGNKEYQQWYYYLQSIHNKYRHNKELILSQLTKQERESLISNLNEMQEIDWGCYPKIPLHRDLHWGNIMIEKGKMKIIDFEHFCIAPIEFEFCNSIFWNDDMSINFSKIYKALKQKKVNINKEVAYKLTSIYFIEQFYQAFNNNDQEKIFLIIKKFKFLIKNHRRYLRPGLDHKTYTRVQTVRDRSILCTIPFIKSAQLL